MKRHCWVARDGTGGLWSFTDKPKSFSPVSGFTIWTGSYPIMLDNSYYPRVTCSNSPVFLCQYKDDIRKIL